jgi:hypothetical protein
MTPWKIPLIVAAITLPILGAFALGEVFGDVGSGSGLAAGSLVVAVIVVVAARQLPRGPIESAAAEDDGRHLLLVPTFAVEEPSAIAEISRAARLEQAAGDLDVLVLAPARIGFLDRWTSDVEPAREAAQRNLVATIAALAKAGVKAEARVGDEDVVQAVEDLLQTFPATEVVLVSERKTVEADSAASAELGRRLDAEFHHVVLDREGDDVAASKEPPAGR